MYKIYKQEISEEQLEKLKNQWFTIDEAIEELAINGNKISKSTFNREANKVDYDKPLFHLGNPKTKKEKSNGKGRPRTLYNRAFIEAIRSFAISDTFINIEEQPIDYFLTDDWKESIEEEFKAVLIDYMDVKDTYLVVEELTNIVGKDIIQKYNALIGQNKFLVHRNRKLEDTKEYYIATHRGVEENANILNRMEKAIQRDIEGSSKLMANNMKYHLKITTEINRKLDEIHYLLNDIKTNKD